MVRGVPISEDITHRQTELKYRCEEISGCETDVQISLHMLGPVYSLRPANWICRIK